MWLSRECNIGWPFHDVILMHIESYWTGTLGYISYDYYGTPCTMKYNQTWLTQNHLMRKKKKNPTYSNKLWRFIILLYSPFLGITLNMEMCLIQAKTTGCKEFIVKQLLMFFFFLKKNRKRIFFNVKQREGKLQNTTQPNNHEALT